MTVTYNSKVASMRRFGVFWKLLFRWRGSIYKLVWLDLTVYITTYFVLNLTYRLLLNNPQRKMFEEVARYCAQFSTFIPMSFVLGFYVTIVVQRWWDQYTVLPWPDALAVYISTNIHGNDDRSRMIRRTIMRYVNLSFTYTMSQVCARVKKRFPTLQHFVDSGLMTTTECTIFDRMNSKTPHLNFWLPLVWAGSIVGVARKEGLIRDDFAVKTIIDTINTFRAGLGSVLNYDWISVPLVYTQTVTLAVYTFFIAELMGRQFVSTDTTVDLYFPIFTFLQFFFFMGWLRVAETLFNPYGEDDDDFEVNWMIDRNIQISYLIVDEMHEEHPDLVRDQYWEEVIPGELPYTLAAEQYRREPPLGSAAQVEVKEDMMNILDPNEMRDSERHDTIGSLIRPMIPRLSMHQSERYSRSAMDLPNSSVSNFSQYKRRRLNTSKTSSIDSRSSVLPSGAPIKRSLTNMFQRFQSTKDTLRRVSATGRPHKSVSRTESRYSVASRGQRTVSPGVHAPASQTAETYPMFSSEMELTVASCSQRSLDRRSSRASAATSTRVNSRPVTVAPGTSSGLGRDQVDIGRTSVSASVQDTPDQRSPSVMSAHTRNSSTLSGDDRPTPRFLPGDYHFLLPAPPDERLNPPQPSLPLPRISPVNPTSLLMASDSPSIIRSLMMQRQPAVSDSNEMGDNASSYTDVPEGVGPMSQDKMQPSPYSAQGDQNSAKNRPFFVTAVVTASSEATADTNPSAFSNSSIPATRQTPTSAASSDGEPPTEGFARTSSLLGSSTDRLPVLYECPPSSTETVCDVDQPSVPNRTETADTELSVSDRDGNQSCDTVS